MQISWDEFLKVDLRVGKIIHAQVFAEAKKPAFLLQIDFGAEIGVKKSSAQLCALYTLDDLIGKRVVAVINFPKKQVGPIQSECLVTGFHDAEGAVVLCVPDRDAPLGAKLC